MPAPRPEKSQLRAVTNATKSNKNTSKKPKAAKVSQQGNAKAAIVEDFSARYNAIICLKYAFEVAGISIPDQTENVPESRALLATFEALSSSPQAVRFFDFYRKQVPGNLEACEKNWRAFYAMHRISPILDCNTLTQYGREYRLLFQPAYRIAVINSIVKSRREQ